MLIGSIAVISLGASLSLGGETAASAIVPQKPTPLAVDETAATAEGWKKMLKSRKIDVYIPKFKFETKYFMAEDLAEMGMPTAFTAAADFSGMTGKRDLHITEVIHQTFVAVNEEGTEAAAATAVVMAETSYSISTVFRADRPFIFLIQEKNTGNILFLGRVVDPGK